MSEVFGERKNLEIQLQEAKRSARFWKRLAFGQLAALVFALVAGSIISTYFAISATKERDQAMRAREDALQAMKEEAVQAEKKARQENKP